MLKTKEENYYEILGITQSATHDEIKKAYRKQARKYHPDVCSLSNAKELFIEVSKAYEILINPDSRAEYDNILNNEFYSESNNSSNFNEYNKEATRKAEAYSNMSLEKILTGVLGLTVEIARGILVGERDKPKLHLGNYITMGLQGVFITICIILSFTGIGALPAGLIVWAIVKSMIRNDRFYGIIPFLISTIIFDLLIVFILVSWINSL